jgi:hypothetical protein
VTSKLIEALRTDKAPERNRLMAKPSGDLSVNMRELEKSFDEHGSTPGRPFHDKVFSCRRLTSTRMHEGEVLIRDFLPATGKPIVSTSNELVEAKSLLEADTFTVGHSDDCFIPPKEVDQRKQCPAGRKSHEYSSPSRDAFTVWVNKILGT